MNKLLVGGVAAAFAIVGFEVWQTNNGTDQNTIRPEDKVQPLQAGAAPNSVNGATGTTPAAATNLTGCQPAGGWSSLGTPSYTYSDAAHIDADRGSTYNDPDGQSQTSTGQNSDTYPGVVLTRTMYDDGVRMGDLVQVTNNATGQTVTARVYDANFDFNKGITAYRDQAEISDYAASELGIQLTPSGDTVGASDITLRAYAGTANDQVDCGQNSGTSTSGTSTAGP